MRKNIYFLAIFLSLFFSGCSIPQEKIPQPSQSSTPASIHSTYEVIHSSSEIKK